MDSIIKHFAPIIYLNRDEGYFPCTIEFYISHSELYHKNKLLVEFGKLTIDKLLHHQKEYNDQLQLKIDSRFIFGELDLLNNLPYYVNYVDEKYKITIQYIFLFAYNGEYKNIFGEFGEHQADIEHCTMVLKKGPNFNLSNNQKDKKTELNERTNSSLREYQSKYFSDKISINVKKKNTIEAFCRIKDQIDSFKDKVKNQFDLTIEKIFLSAHGYDDGEWFKKEDKSLNKIQFSGVKPILYAAKHSHALYSRPKTVIRIAGLANDKTSESTDKWDPKKVVIINESTKWNTYIGYLGFGNHIKTPLHQKWWKNESKKSNNNMRRFFNCCF